VLLGGRGDSGSGEHEFRSSRGAAANSSSFDQRTHADDSAPTQITDEDIPF